MVKPKFHLRQRKPVQKIHGLRIFIRKPILKIGDSPTLRGPLGGSHALRVRIKSTNVETGLKKTEQPNGGISISETTAGKVFSPPLNYSPHPMRQWEWREVRRNTESSSDELSEKLKVFKSKNLDPLLKMRKGMKIDEMSMNKIYQNIGKSL